MIYTIMSCTQIIITSHIACFRMAHLQIIWHMMTHMNSYTRTYHKGIYWAKSRTVIIVVRWGFSMRHPSFVVEKERYKYIYQRFLQSWLLGTRHGLPRRQIPAPPRRGPVVPAPAAIGLRRGRRGADRWVHGQSAPLRLAPPAPDDWVSGGVRRRPASPPRFPRCPHHRPPHVASLRAATPLVEPRAPRGRMCLQIEWSPDAPPPGSQARCSSSRQLVGLECCGGVLERHGPYLNNQIMYLSYWYPGYILSDMVSAIRI